MASTACWGSAAILRAASIAAVSTSSSGTTWLARPISLARAAGMRSPVNAYSLASSRLVWSGQVSGPPSAATRPTVTCGSERNADSAMYTTSDSAMTLQPRPTAGPFTAATTGMRHRIMLTTRSRPSAMVDWRTAVSSIMRSRRSKSPPAENARPAPVITATRASASALSCGNSSVSPRCSSGLIALS